MHHRYNIYFVFINNITIYIYIYILIYQLRMHILTCTHDQHRNNENLYNKYCCSLHYDRGSQPIQDVLLQVWIQHTRVCGNAYARVLTLHRTHRTHTHIYIYIYIDMFLPLWSSTFLLIYFILLKDVTSEV